MAALAARALLRKSPAAVLAARNGAVACALRMGLCLPWLSYTWAQRQSILELEEFFRPHVEELREVLKHDPVAQDSILKEWARRNCREHPGKCFPNWRANVNRIVFGYPVTAHAGGE